MALAALGPPNRPCSSSASAPVLPGTTNETSHKGTDMAGQNTAFLNGANSTLPPSRSSRFQSLGEQLLVPSRSGTGTLSSSQSGPLPTVDSLGLNSHGVSKGMMVSDNPEAKGSGLPPMSRSSLSSKASLARPASTASLPTVANAMGLTGSLTGNRRPSGTAGVLGEDSLQRSRPRLGSKQESELLRDALGETRDRAVSSHGGTVKSAGAMAVSGMPSSSLPAMTREGGFELLGPAPKNPADLPEPAGLDFPVVARSKSPGSPPPTLAPLKPESPGLAAAAPHSSSLAPLPSSIPELSHSTETGPLHLPQVLGSSSRFSKDGGEKMLS
jgi:hypothetical protein